ncbi:MAG: glycosyltransferase family 2 protein [Planctomycetota bacterium]
MPAWSVVICCANAQATLPAALDSAQWADEIVVVDSGSNDATAQIAQDAGVAYRLEPWRGYTGQKKFGAELARHDWVFILDGDEEISPVLASQLQRFTDAELEQLDVVYVRRRNWVMGKPVRAWWPDWQSRGIHRQRVTWPEEALHESRQPTDPARVARLTGHLDHKKAGSPDFADYFSGKRMDERLLMVAREMHARGKRVGSLGLWLRPQLAFFKFFVLKRGFIDGTFGLLIAQKAATSTQLKYAALWAVQNGIAEPAEPEEKQPDRLTRRSTTDNVRELPSGA